jgi:hypothetical protein
MTQDSNQLLAWIALAAFVAATAMHTAALVKLRRGRWTNLFVFGLGWVVCAYFTAGYAIVALDLAPAHWPQPIATHLLRPAIPFLAAIIASYPALLLQLQQQYGDYTVLVEQVTTAQKCMEELKQLRHDMANMETNYRLYQDLRDAHKEKIARLEAQIDQLLAENEELRRIGR